MKGTSAFVFVLILVSAWPLVLVGLFALDRRFPSGVPPQQRWMPWGAGTVFYLGSSVFFFVTGASVRGILFLTAGIAAAALTLDQRRRSRVSDKA